MVSHQDDALTEAREELRLHVLLCERGRDYCADCYAVARGERGTGAGPGGSCAADHYFCPRHYLGCSQYADLSEAVEDVEHALKLRRTVSA